MEGLLGRTGGGGGVPRYARQDKRGVARQDKVEGLLGRTDGAKRDCEEQLSLQF